MDRGGEIFQARDCAGHPARILQAGVQPGARRTAYPLWSYQVAIDLDHFSAVVGHVQHQSAAAVAPLTDRPRPLTTSSTGQRPSATLLPPATDLKVPLAVIHTAAPLPVLGRCTPAVRVGLPPDQPLVR
jgi:hypothetical protein